MEPAQEKCAPAAVLWRTDSRYWRHGTWAQRFGTGQVRPLTARWQKMESNGRAIRTHPARWVPTLYFAEGMPFFAVSLIAGLLYKRMGLANDTIAFYTSWLLLPWSLKPLWSPVVEMYKT